MSTEQKSRFISTDWSERKPLTRGKGEGSSRPIDRRIKSKIGPGQIIITFYSPLEGVNIRLSQKK